jgi:branched-chain amino acid transport system permease protein
VALFLIAAQGMLLPQGRQLRPVSTALGVSDTAFHVDGVRVTSTQVLAVSCLFVLGVAAIVFFRFVPQGTAILAVSQDVTAARVVGISVGRISLLTWGIAGLLGGVGGVVLGADRLFTPGSFTAFLLIPGFAAAVFGGMTSLPGAFVGGLVLGEVQQFAQQDAQYIAGLKHVPGSPAELVVFAVVLLVLLVRPRGLLGREA